MVLASSATAVLLATAPALASAHYNDDYAKSGKDGIHAKADLNVFTSLFHKGDKDKDRDDDTHASSTPGLNANGVITVAGTVQSVGSSSFTLKAKNNNAVYTVNATSTSGIRVGDMIVARGTLSGSTVTAAKIYDGANTSRNFLAAVGMEAGGVVTSINGSTLTIKPFGTKATTTVTTNASTTYKVNGQAASSTDITVGSRVLVDGNATSDTSITASLISIFNAGIGFFKHIWSH